MQSAITHHMLQYKKERQLVKSHPGDNQYICSGQCDLSLRSNMTRVLPPQTGAPAEGRDIVLLHYLAALPNALRPAKGPGIETLTVTAHLILIVFIHSNSQCWQRWGWASKRKKKTDF